ncbi:DUF58 domain-containing protein [Mycobacterium sp. TY815]|uniref:DUF58 domain-containing protein n=1 Tax=Mycobacterium sp. TY815 TaxID=3050581 RepID=UPI0027424C2F|nr:DUF58 domain-containing protein [Mycobacterium sp. TY815]MDP7707424.1 DUF58 domain-containing protein [Mycobacterium sp. TY815]
MGQLLHAAKRHFPGPTRGLLDGGRYALLHTRTMEFDDLRPYVAGDEIRDIDWKATARAGTVLIRRYVSEKHHKILLIADAGRNMNALAPSGELKRDVALHTLGAFGLITLGRADELALVYGDHRGSVRVGARRGESHVEALLHRFYTHTTTAPGRSDITTQLDYAATHYRRRMLVIVISDEPDVDERLHRMVRRLGDRHDLLWVMIADMPAVGTAADEPDGYDVDSGAHVLGGAALGPRIVEAYRRREAERRAALHDFFSTRGIRVARIAASSDIRASIVALTREHSYAG